MAAYAKLPIEEFIMKIIDYIITKILYPACVVFTVMSGVFLIFTQIVTKYQKPALYIDSYFMFFVLAILIALSNRVFYINKLSALAKTVLHAFLVITSIIVVFYVRTGTTESSPLVLILLFSVLYAVVATPVLLIISSKNRKKKENKEYKSMFSE